MVVFPRTEYRRTFEALCAALPERQACKITVELLALAHDRGCEADLARELDQLIGSGDLPDLGVLRRRFAPDPASLPSVSVTPVPLDSYEALVGASTMAEQHA
ncbi:MAG: hypothetical protein KGI94_14760 [Paracoccaceae bacterium]|nr:hypothetical protein [Paracoccaceae bacterium]